MLKVSSAKQVQGTLELPPSPDLFALSAVVALTSRTPTAIHPFPATSLGTMWKDAFASQAVVEVGGDTLRMEPRINGEACPLVLPYTVLPYRDLIVFTALGLGKTVEFASVSPKVCEKWRTQAAAAGCELVVERAEEKTVMWLAPDTVMQLSSPRVAVDDVHAVLGLALGLGTKVSFEMNASLSSPIRHLLPAFGYPIEIRSSQQERTNDPIGRRIRRMQAKKKGEAPPPTYTLSADFSTRPTEPTHIELPGDDVLGALLIAAKSLIQRGTLLLENVPLEPWATQTVSLIRRMGCAPGLQETGQSTFGSVGTASLQRFKPSGRKVECRPLYQFWGQLGAMIAIAQFADGESVFRGLTDLRAEEPDGIEQVIECFETIGVHHGEMPDGIVLKGSSQYDGFDIDTDLPAGLSGSFAIAGLRCMGTTTIVDTTLSRRWPRFGEMLDMVCEYRA